MPTSIQVEGVGNLTLPLSQHDVVKLKTVSQRAPFGLGLETLLDANVRRAWQVDASKVSSPQMPDFFSKGILDLVVPAVIDLGIDPHALGLDVKLYKLLLYEQGGHFKFHRDTEKEAGMFGTMILQFPTQSGHEGGELEICHAKKSVKFDFSGDKSSTDYFSTVFFCDCEHKLAEVTGGNRLCLVFSLLRNNPTLTHHVNTAELPRYMPAVQERVQALFKQWADDVKDNPSRDVLAIPLSHKYTENSLSFAGLKGHDRVVAALVSSCINILDVHLCLFVLKVYNSDSYLHTEQWKTLDDKIFKPFDYTDAWEVKECEDLFGTKPDKVHEEPYLGNQAGKETSTYYTAALVVWPRDSRINVLSRKLDFECLVELLEEQHKHSPERTEGDLNRLIANADGGARKWHSGWHSVSSIEALLEFCIRHDFRDAAFTIMKKYVWNLIAEKSSTGKGIASAIRKYGWDDCFKDVFEAVLENDDLIEKFSQVTLFPKCLQANGLHDEAVCVARKLQRSKELSAARLGSLSSFKYFETKLLEFFSGCGFGEETLSTLSVASLDDTAYLAQVVKGLGEKSFPRIEALWIEKLKTAEECHWEGLETDLIIHAKVQERSKRKEKVERQGRKLFLHEFAKFVLALDRENCHDAAMGFAKMNFGINLEELYGWQDEIDDKDALVMLLRCDERYHDTVRRVEVGCLKGLVETMRTAAGLIGVKKDEKVTQLFGELLLQQLMNKERVNVALLDAIYWLGDEKLIKRAEGDPLMMNILAKDAVDSFVAKAHGWKDFGKNGFREMLQARLRHFLNRLDDPDVQSFLSGMVKAASLIGLNNDDKLMQPFEDLLWRLVREEQITVDLMEAVFWLGNKKMVDAMVDAVKRDASITDNLATAEGDDLLGRKPRRGKTLERTDLERS